MDGFFFVLFELGMQVVFIGSLEEMRFEIDDFGLLFFPYLRHEKLLGGMQNSNPFALYSQTDEPPSLPSPSHLTPPSSPIVQQKTHAF